MPSKGTVLLMVFLPSPRIYSSDSNYSDNSNYSGYSIYSGYSDGGVKRKRGSPLDGQPRDYCR